VAAERAGMRRIHDVFRLRLLEGKSPAQSAGCSPSTVHEYFVRAKAAGLVGRGTRTRKSILAFVDVQQP
jgi:hypothetical protein